MADRQAGGSAGTLLARLIDVSVERWPVNGAFVISRGARTHVDLIVCTVGAGGATGRGEGSPIYYRGEDAQGCAEAIRAFASGGSFDRNTVNRQMPPGAARNALDCALWDLEARVAGRPVWALAGLQPPAPLATAITLSVDSPERMEAAAGRAASEGFGLIKCKLTGQGDLDRIAAVRRGAPRVRLIVDANESWDGQDVAAMAANLADLGVELIEQPLRAGDDAQLHALSLPVPLCADESCHDSTDLDRLDMYQAINIKLDKAGGLTEALRLSDGARRRGRAVMVGCMLGTSLGIAPAFLVAQRARWVDLDGALLLERDREGALRATGGALEPGQLWGEPISPSA